MTDRCLLLIVLGTLLVPARASCEKPPPPDVDATQRIVRAVVAEAKQLAGLDKPCPGDDLTDRYIRVAAAEARRLPAEKAVPAFLAALGIALDDSTLLRRNLLFGRFCRAVESDAEREARLRVLGAPSLRGRHDWCQHFAVSGTLTALAGPTAAEAAGLLKERLDMAPGGSGFSFADLSADYAGIAFAVALNEGSLTLDAVAARFSGEAFLPNPRGLREGLTAKQVEEAYGSTGDERFRKESERVRQRIRELPVYKAR